MVTGLITGLHNPDASHLLLVESVAGAGLAQRAYDAAVAGALPLARVRRLLPAARRPELSAALPSPGMHPDPDRLAAIAARLPGALIALDFDGTLAPIVSDPDAARPVPGVIDTLDRAGPGRRADRDRHRPRRRHGAGARRPGRAFRT